MIVLLDSVILIDHFNQVEESKVYLSEILEDAAISVITRAEVLTGFSVDNREQAIKFLDLFIL